MKVTSLEIPHKEIYFIIEERNKFPDIISDLEKNLLKINDNLEIKFISFEDIQNSESINLYTILPYNFKNTKIQHHFLIIDEDYETSNYNFFRNYFKFGDYVFNRYKFRIYEKCH